MSFDRRKLRRLIFWILTVTLAVSAGVMVVQYLQGQMGHEAYAEAEAISGLTREPEAEVAPEKISDPESESEPQPQPEEEPAPEALPVVQDPAVAAILQTVDVAALQQVNEEVVGWLYIPNGGVSYPLMRHKDNEFYLTHNWKKENYIDGAIYMDCRNSLDGTDFNTIIYGHNKEDGYMFSELVHYREQAYYETHPYIYLSTTEGTYRYAVFSAHEVEADGYVYQLKNLDAEAFLTESAERSVLETTVEVTALDRIITLSTCTGYWTDTRFVVQAVLDGILQQ